MLVYATGYGGIYGWDLRQALPKPKGKGTIKATPAFKLETDLRDGILTSMSIYPDQVCFLCYLAHCIKRIKSVPQVIWIRNLQYL